MGQQMLIIALLASFLVSMAVLGLRGALNDSDNIAASQYEEEQAVNLSSTGVNMTISTLSQNKTWRAGFLNVPLADQGTLSVKLQDLGVDSVRIISTGVMNNTQHTSIVDVKIASVIPMAESALALYGDEVNFKNAGKAFGIDGNDHDISGYSGSEPPVSGIAVPSPDIESLLEAQLINDKVYRNVTGAGGWPSVGVSTITNDQVVQMRNFFKENATITLPPGLDASNHVYGSISRPEIVYVGGDKQWTGTVKGTGILVVDGSLLIGGNVNWTGLVITVAQDIDIEFGDFGNPHIIGATMIGTEVPSPYKITNVHINGNPQLDYSYEALATVMQNLRLFNIDVVRYYE